MMATVAFICTVVMIKNATLKSLIPPKGRVQPSFTSGIFVKCVDKHPIFQRALRSGPAGHLESRKLALNTS
ncbi:hypothetical protein BKA67DRAFT_98130 [Truncatella angustata]|uniref:Uncharacterized protein n=1 Tax=Truncatella angustata TaxID=152316 RepID=A0A9P8RHT5_9PEZI|nr:uncharacterized protein BKA67DRAFT_98130 [Truncatella angustata]KAH6646284.1 hypothetical protein BKA67DRAFT_98130 [Truncatella angustata]